MTCRTSSSDMVWYTPSGGRGDDRQHHVRRAGGVVEDRLVGQLAAALAAEGLPRIAVGVPQGEIRAGDVESNAVTWRETVGRRLEVELHLVHPPGLDQLFP